MNVTVEVSPTLAKIVRSPLHLIATALTGVSVSFAPLLLYWSGQGKFYPRYGWIVVPMCFAVIFFVPVYFYRLGNVVAKEVRRNSV